MKNKKEQQLFQKAVFGGYVAEQVDKLVESLENENKVLTKKLKIVVEKLEEYNSREQEIKIELENAKQTIKSMLKNAEQEAELILRNSQIVAQNKLELIKDEIIRKETELNTIKDMTKGFVRELSEQFENQEKALNEFINKCDEKYKTKEQVQKVSPVETSEQKETKEVKEVIEEISQAVSEAGKASLKPLNYINDTEEQKSQEPQKIVTKTGLEMKVIEVTLGGSKQLAKNLNEKNKKETYNTDNITEQTKKIDFENLEFGTKYKTE